ncbi:MAG: hypothetical protein JOZ99_04155 [Actinobacteria bacterium]|nr:hypothetical protein [Actinomycetota bacterium]
MPSYRLKYGEGDEALSETLNDVQLEREDGWTTFFRGRDAILRVRDEHIQSLESVDESG